MKDIQGIDCFGKLHSKSWVTVITNDHEGGFEYEYNMAEYDEWYSIDDEPITWENEIFHLITAGIADNYTILEVYANDTEGEIL